MASSQEMVGNSSCLLTPSISVLEKCIGEVSAKISFLKSIAELWSSVPQFALMI